MNAPLGSTPHTGWRRPLYGNTLGRYRRTALRVAWWAVRGGRRRVLPICITPLALTTAIAAAAGITAGIATAVVSTAAIAAIAVPAQREDSGVATELAANLLATSMEHRWDPDAHRAYEALIMYNHLHYTAGRTAAEQLRPLAWDTMAHSWDSYLDRNDVADRNDTPLRRAYMTLICNHLGIEPQIGDACLELWNDNGGVDVTADTLTTMYPHLNHSTATQLCKHALYANPRQ